MAAVWCAANMTAFSCIQRSVRRLFPEDRTGETGMHCTLLFVGTIVLAATLVGACGVLSGVSLLLKMLVLSGGLWLIVRRVFPETLPAERLDRFGPDASADTATIRFWTFAALLLVSHSVINGVLTFPDDFDSLWYHLPLIDYWVQSGSLYAADGARWYYPANSELLGLWLSAGFSGDFLTPLNNVPVVILWAFATACVCRQLGITGIMQTATVLAVLCTYTTLHETDDASNDLLVVAGFTSSVAYILRFIGRQRSCDLFGAGISIGLLAGVKLFAVGYAFGAVCLLVLGTWLVCGWRDGLKSVTIALLWALPFGAYWYVQNFVVTGTPVYPVGAAQPASEMTYPNLWSTSIAGNGHPELFSLLCEAVWKKCGPVHLAAMLLWPVACCGIWFSRSGLTLGDHTAATNLRQQAAAGVLIFAVSGCCLTWAVTPYSVEDQPETLNHLRWAYTPVRYGLCFLSFSVVAMLCATNHLTKHGIWFSRGVLGVVVYQGFGLAWLHRGEFEFLWVLLVALDAGIVLMVLQSILSRRQPGQRRLCWTLLLCAVLSGLSLQRSPQWHSGYAAHFERLFGVSFFSDLNTGPNHSRQILVFDQRSYPYFGSYRQNAVIQPAAWIGMEETWRLTEDRKIDDIIIRSRPECTIFPYEAGNSELASDQRLQLLNRSAWLQRYQVSSGESVSEARVR